MIPGYSNLTGSPIPSDMEGVLIVDKPPGITSHDVVDDMRKLTGFRRIGHAGTLDPNATGLLLLLFGRATKVSKWLMELEKEYIFTLQLGIETTTDDRWGDVIRLSETGQLSERMIRQVVMGFRGRYRQIAPAVSALKHKGRPLYRIVREGGQAPIKTRVVEIRAIEILDLTPPFVTARVVCSSGTYIRAMARDIGRKLGCGGIVFCLRRTRIGSFDDTMAMPLQSLVNREVDVADALIPIGEALSHLRKARVKHGRAEAIRMGKQPDISDLVDPNALPLEGVFCLIDSEGRLIGIARREAHVNYRLRLERVI